MEPLLPGAEAHPRFQRRPLQTTNIRPPDRSLVWKLTKERYYQVPVVRRGRDVIFETDQNSQVIAKFLDSELNLACSRTVGTASRTSFGNTSITTWKESPSG